MEECTFSQPKTLSKEHGSVQILISDIDDFKDFKKKYELQKQKEVMLCVGGPAAEDQTVLATIIPKIRDKFDDIIYATRDYRESNVNHSAKQSHARHGNALNADKNLTGHSLLINILMRNLFGVNTEDALKPDYLKINVKFTINPKKLRIYFGNELNWLKQEYKKKMGQLTEHDANRIESVLSQKILEVLEKEANLQLSGKSYNREDKNTPSSIHVTFNEKEDQQVAHENEEFKKAGIESKKLTS